VEPGYVRPSIFANDPTIKLEFDSSYFNDPQVWGQGNEGIIVNDGSSGQRNFTRNLDAIMGILVRPRGQE